MKQSKRYRAANASEAGHIHATDASGETVAGLDNIASINSRSDIENRKPGNCAF